MVLCAAGVVCTGALGTWAIISTSFFMSLMYPTIFTIAIRGLDKEQTQLGSSLIVMAIIGGAVCRGRGHAPVSATVLSFDARHLNLFQVLTPLMGLVSDVAP